MVIQLSLGLMVSVSSMNQMTELFVESTWECGGQEMREAETREGCLRTEVAALGHGIKNKYSWKD